MSAQARWTRTPGTWRIWLPLSLFVLLAACDGLLDVAEDPEEIDAGSVSGPAAFQARFVGSQADFITSVDDAVMYSALFTDELTWGGSFLARDEVDRRVIRTSNDIVATLYTLLQVANYTSSSLQKEILEGLFPQLENPWNSSQLARVSLSAGYSKLFLADLFCSLAFGGVGPEVQPAAAYRMALEDFTLAIEASGAPEGVRNAARVGRARAYLQLDETAEARNDAGEVPPGFAYALSYSSNSAREENDIFNFTWGNRRLTVATSFQEVFLDDSDELDSRVAVLDRNGTTFNGNMDLWVPLKYPSRDAPVRLASWEEAQFMIAEIEGGGSARDIINGVRAAHGIFQLWDEAAEADDDAILAKVREERARTLFMEGQRMGDMRRYLAHSGIDLFPGGPGQGAQTCMPLPDVERDNNPDL